jgi:hypothetical protein
MKLRFILFQHAGVGYSADTMTPNKRRTPMVLMPCQQFDPKMLWAAHAVERSRLRLVQGGRLSRRTHPNCCNPLKINMQNYWNRRQQRLPASALCYLRFLMFKIPRFSYGSGLEVASQSVKGFPFRRVFVPNLDASALGPLLISLP